MSEFDDAMAEADLEIFEVFADPAVLSDNSIPTSTYDCTIIIDRDLQLLIDGQMTIIGTVATINAPPAGIDVEWTFTIATGSNAGTYTLREKIEQDNWVQRWAVTVG